LRCGYCLALLPSGRLPKKKRLTLDGAERIIAAAKAKAQELKSPGGVIAVVDAGGNLMALARIDGTFAAGANISIGKVRTAVLFQKPTKFSKTSSTKYAPRWPPCLIHSSHRCRAEFRLFSTDKSSPE
jgi:uncharacterized protein GlcG (DUF336 family)